MIASRVLRPVALLLVVGISCGKDSSGPVPLPTGTLVLSPPGAGFGATEGGANPGAQTINITNASSGNLGGVRRAITYAPNQPTGWLSASLSDTTTPSTLTLNATTGSLGIGSYSAFVAISANGATNAPQIIEVVFLVSVLSVFVSESDPQAIDDATCGLGPVGWGAGFHPCLSITQGIARAGALSRTKVLVADGIYDESVTMVNGISVLGGHQPDTWQRHVTTTNTVIQGSATIPATAHRFAVRATNISSATVFEGFVIRGPVSGALGGNSYGIYVSTPSANLTIRQNVVFAGRAGPGSPGTNGTNGALGVNAGAYSAGAYDAFFTTGTGPCDATNNRQLSNGGIRLVGADDISGGRGGGNSCPVSTNRQRLSAQAALSGNAGGGPGGAGGSAGASGFDATDSTSATGRICILPTSPMDGDSGATGGAGTSGGFGPGGSNGTGSVAGGHWVGTPGTGGVGGGNGGGGGGGGAGGGAIRKGVPTPRDILGGHGGGGGSGGGGGTGGGAGSAGGGAFGLFVVGTAAPTVSGNIIVAGEGGSGGSGGNAGAGGLGGIGGAGGVVSATVFCAGRGGKGGNGGAGGHGGGGGGGSGGASYGIYTSGIPTPNYCDLGVNAISGGVGGPAGPGGGSLLNPGGAGVAGANVTCSIN